MLRSHPLAGYFVRVTLGYRLVQLSNGTYSIRSLAHQETFHPLIGPVAEAEALFVRQLDLVARLTGRREEFVVWDVGLGAAANALTVIRATRQCACPLRLVSFDITSDALRFAQGHADALGYFGDYAPVIDTLLKDHQVTLMESTRTVRWDWHLADFPTLIEQAEREAVTTEGDHGLVNGSTIVTRPSPGAYASSLPIPHAIMWDPYSPAQNPAMWTQPLLTRLFRLLGARQPCSWASYSRSTMLRVSLLLAGFFVGRGQATGEKEETTIAANRAELIARPLDRRWLMRARRSTSAEPLWTPVYRQASLQPETAAALLKHPQFNLAINGSLESCPTPVVSKSAV